MNMVKVRKNYIFIFFTLCGILFAQTDVSGSVSGIWDMSGSPYNVVDSICVPTGETLHIMPGVKVVFQGHYKFCVDSAAVLKAIGTETDTITFFPADTGEWSPNWNGIRFYNSSDACSLMYCEIAYDQANGNSQDDSCGGGIFCRYSDITIKNCYVRNNTAKYDGGGIYCYYSTPIIDSNVISGNTTDSQGGGIYIHIPNYDTIRVSDNIIVENGSSSWDNGGGIYISGSGVIENNTLSENYGSAIYWYYGYTRSIINNIISNNHDRGIDAGNYGNVVISNNDIIGNGREGIYCRDIDSCLVVNNTITYNGRDGVYFYVEGGNTMIIEGNNIYGNSSGISIYFYSNGSVIIERNYISNNGGGDISGAILSCRPCFNCYC